MRRARYTVLVFFTPHCPVVRAHDARLQALQGAFAASGVQFYFVDSESGGFLQHAEQWRNPDPTSNHHHWRFSLRQNEASMGAVDGNPRAWLNETELIGAIPCFLDHEAKPR